MHSFISVDLIHFRIVGGLTQSGLVYVYMYMFVSSKVGLIIKTFSVLMQVNPVVPILLFIEHSQKKKVQICTFYTLSPTLNLW